MTTLYDPDLAGVSGLDAAEAVRRLAENGPNSLPEAGGRSLLAMLLGVIREPMFLLLLGAGVIYFILGDALEGGVLFFFVLAIIGLTLVQEARAEHSLQALRQLTAPRCRVVRDGAATELAAEELVPGDIVILQEGDRVPADAFVVRETELLLDEALLTGESEPVAKLPRGLIVLPNADLFRADTVYSGSTVVRGRALVEVSATGSRSVYGDIGKSLAEIEPALTPLQLQTRKLVFFLGSRGVVLSLLVVLVVRLRGETWLSALLAGIALAMAVIPEELPVVLAIFTALGARRLARRDALIRKLPAVETLGSTTVLCVDKTGTLTENRMAVRGLFIHGQLHLADLPLRDKDDRMLLEAGILGSEKDPYDPMELAFLDLAALRGPTPEDIYATHRLVHDYPFDSRERVMAHVWESDHGRQLVAKGSPETILAITEMTEQERGQAMRAAASMASRGLRVIAFSETVHVAPPYRDNFHEYPLEFRGLIGLKDPPRAGVSEAVSQCREAGIRLVMITGDHPATAAAIADEIGMLGPHEVTTGVELEALDSDSLRERVAATDIFARVAPQHKLLIVEALCAAGEVVAMTGDGVNDAPALRRADIGIAMGRRGTQVAREASELVLLDDDFATIIDAVADGRRIHDNIRKAIGYILVIHIPIALAALLAPLAGLPLLLLPEFIVLAELIIDPTCSIVFEAEPAEPDIMRRGPSPAGRPLLDRALTLQVLSQGSAILVAFLGTYWIMLEGLHYDLAFSRTMALAVFVTANIALVQEALSATRSLPDTLRRRGNKSRTIVNAGAFSALLLIVYLPPLRRVFDTVPLSAPALLAAIGIGLASVVWWELVKWRRRAAARGARPAGAS
ncbi:MAG: cation-translocating P-type ATPase [Candidatus Geothermincolia bacterium]